MTLSEKAKELAAEFADGNVMLGEIKRHGKAIKKDHRLALELWSTKSHTLRLLAVLIFDKKCLTQDFINRLAVDLLPLESEERNQLTDWLLANQLMKDKKINSLMQTWEQNTSPILRRLFWYHQARLRWTGQVPPDNSLDLLDSLEKNIADAEPDVQWAMNFCAGQIGVHQPIYRARCISLGEKFGLYKDDHVAKNCVPSYLPEFIRIEAAKRE